MWVYWSNVDICYLIYIFIEYFDSGALSVPLPLLAPLTFDKTKIFQNSELATGWLVAGVWCINCCLFTDPDN